MIIKNIEILNANNLNKKIIYIKLFLIKFFGLILRIINHKYYYNICKVITFYNTKELVKIKKNGYFFIFKLNDPYYSRLISNYYCYEIEISNFIKFIKGYDFNFYDLGANYGYWSIIFSNLKECKYCCAVEPLRNNFKFLQINNKLNNNKFTTYKRLIGDGKNEKTKIYYDKNIPNNVGSSTTLKKINYEFVKQIKIDSLLIKKDRNLNIIKIDIEGEEINAIKQIIKLKLKNYILIYECHGKDKDHNVSRFLLNNNFKVFDFSISGNIKQIDDISLLNKIKSKSNKGYNFIALNLNNILNDRIINLI